MSASAKKPKLYTSPLSARTRDSVELDDTMQDLIVDLAGSLVVGALGYLYLKTRKDS